jgi:hypothetical protein
MKKILFYSTFLLLLSCSNNNQKQGDEKPQTKQLNISILLDLSDRIDTTKHPAIPEHYQRDIEIVRTLTEYFKANMETLTAWKAKGKIRIFFSPAPSNPTINDIANKLNIDCSKLDNRGRKQVYDTISGLFTQNLTDIYNQTIQTSRWEGSDIWRFLKDDVKDFCIEKDTTYRNILIILTDGYIYHKQSVFNNGNRFSYLLESNIRQYRKTNWNQLVKNTDFGLVVERNDLNNLEILVLEVSAENSKNKIDEDILKYTIDKWFQEMNVARCAIYSSDLPANTKTRINNFLFSK